MKEYMEYLKYAIKNSYEEFFEKGFKNPGLLENWLTYNLFYLYRDGNPSRFAHKHIKYLEENIENNKDELLKFLISNYVEEIQTKAGKDSLEIQNNAEQVVEDSTKIENKSETQLVGPLEKIINNIAQKKGATEAINILRIYIDPVNTAEDIEMQINLENEIEKYINNLNVSNKDELKSDYKNTIFFRYSKLDILKMMCASTIKDTLQNPIVNIADLKKYDDKSKNEFNLGEFAVVANSIEPDIDKSIAAMEAIRSGKIQNQYMSQEERA